ncbi:MAG: hypothetical protein M1825_005068 [Sarcosagium campestre]|nr:MAG: hypothetical protein M1825_005068 [Sarcosagium campestre]
MALVAPPYQPKDAVDASIKGLLIAGSAGALVSAIQNSLTKQNVGPLGFISRTGSTVAIFAAMGGAHEFVSNASANLRQKDDSWNQTFGGFFAGAILGLKFRTVPSVLGYGATLAVIMGTFDYTGGALTGFGKDPTVDYFERKQDMRKNFRRPIQETIDQVGEGRGIRPPGYDERRQERIKQKYGVDVPVASSSQS